MNRCIIFSAGTLYKPYPHLQPGDYVIAADAGLKNCLRAGFTPDLLLGDWDSMKQPKVAAGTVPADNICDPAGTIPITTYPVEKDDTDTMLAIKKALEAGYCEIHIYGGTGGRRSDHTLANLQSLAYIAVRGGRGYIHDKGIIYTAISNSSLDIIVKNESERTVPIDSLADTPDMPNVTAARRGSLLSVFSMTTVSEGVSLTGVKYPLEEGSLSCGFPLGVSNSIVDSQATISVRNGILLIGIGV